MKHIVKGRWVWVDGAQVFRVLFIRGGKLHRADAASAFSFDVEAVLRVA